MILALAVDIGRLIDENVRFFLTDRACGRLDGSRPRFRVSVLVGRSPSSRQAVRLSRSGVGPEGWSSNTPSQPDPLRASNRRSRTWSPSAPKTRAWPMRFRSCVVPKNLFEPVLIVRRLLWGCRGRNRGKPQVWGSVRGGCRQSRDIRDRSPTLPGSRRCLRRLERGVRRIEAEIGGLPLPGFSAQCLPCGRGRAVPACHRETCTRPAGSGSGCDHASATPRARRRLCNVACIAIMR